MEERNLDRFIKIQEEDYQLALHEIKNGHKESHWMWYIFPQLEGLGFSYYSRYYGIRDLEEAQAYLSHEILGKHLLEITEVLLNLDSNCIREVMEYPDDLKLRSSMTLFILADPTCLLFQQILDKYFDGKMDDATIKILKK